MNRTWPYLPRPNESSRAAITLLDRRPVVITGPAGIGKTSLAREVMATVGGALDWLVGSPPTRDTPLAALARLVPVDGTGDVPQVVSAVTERLVGGDAVLAVEGTADLDAASATVLARLIRAGEIPGLIVMTRSPTLADTDPVLTSALSAARAVHIEMGALSPDDLAVILGEFLGAPLDFTDVVRIHTACGGNPFYARHLATGTAGAGAFRRRADGTFCIAAEFTVTGELEVVVGANIEAAEHDTRRVLEFLSVLTPLTTATVAALGLSGAVDPPDPALLAVDHESVYPAHAILADVVRGRLGGLRRIQLAATLVDTLEKTADSPVVTLHRASLAAEIGRVLPPHTNLASAATAFNHGQFALSERLATLALEGEPAISARLAQIRAVAAQGDALRAQRLLDDVDADSLGDAELVMYLMTACVHFSTALGDHDRSLAILDTLGPRICDPAMRGAVPAMRAIAQVNAGRLWQALSSARVCLTGEWDGSVWPALARSVEAEVLRRLGETDRAQLIGEDAVRLAEAAGPLAGIGALRTLVLTHIASGQLDAAEDIAARFADIVALQSLSQAVACATMAAVAVARGRFNKAQRLAVDCLHALPDDDRSGLGRGVASMLAWVRMSLGDAEGARWALARCESSTVGGGEWAEVNPLLCDGIARAAGGEVTIPIARFLAAAQISFAYQTTVDGVTHLYRAVRFGDHDAARQLCEPRYRIQGVVAGLIVDHARALLAADARGLLGVSDRFTELGYLPFAADALAHAIVALRSAGAAHLASGLAPRLTRLRRNADDYLSPAILAAEVGADLTPRELEIHAMTAAGRSRSDIAEALGIRPSTVTAYRTRVREGLQQ